MMIPNSSTVFVIDDDSSARRGISRLIRASGLSVETYASATDFLNREHHDVIGCIVLDVKMPGMDGLQLQAELAKADYTLPIIFVSAHSDVPIAARAMKKGAVDFLTKPVDGDHLLKAIEESLQKDRAHRKSFHEKEAVQNKMNTLSPREYTVLKHVIAGMLNKQIAFALSITEDTVKVHRRRVMRKMGAGSLAELVRFAELVAVKPADHTD